MRVLSVEAAVLYLEDKGFVVKTEVRRRITSEGVDTLEGETLV